MTASTVPLVLATLLAFAAPCRSAIQRCVGPQGEPYFTDRECPPGYALDSSSPSTPARSPAEPPAEPPAVPARVQPAPPPPAEQVAPADPVCRTGTFDTQDRGSSYDVFFTNTGERECRSVKASCLCSLSFGSYRQSENVDAAGSFPPGARRRIATVSTTGPAGRDLDWSWCKFRF